jgi:signal transduction histidine kinase
MPIAPLVALERFVVDDVDQPLRSAEGGLRVASGHVHFQFDYAGLSFTAPQKVRYRYMLEGFDHNWTEAGARRSAYYTNIPPGKYTFRVQAANNDGLWSTSGAALAFELRPRFYQTAGGSMCSAAAGGRCRTCVAAAEAAAAARLRASFRAVLGERSRIAREIHDTLAQGYVGISVQLGSSRRAFAARETKMSPRRNHLDLTRAYVREGLADARQSIWALRTQDSSEKTLPVKMRRIAEAAGGGGLTGPVQSSSVPIGPCSPGETERELLRVAQEAIHNVKKHAGAKELIRSIGIQTGVTITLEVRDDGRGWSGGKEGRGSAGHFGLTGMRERAAAIGGTLRSEQPGRVREPRFDLSAPARTVRNA